MDSDILLEYILLGYIVHPKTFGISGCRDSFIITRNMHAQGGRLNPASTDSLCADACRLQKACYGYDWGQGCYLLFDANSLNNLERLDGVTHNRRQFLCNTPPEPAVTTPTGGLSFIFPLPYF